MFPNLKAEIARRDLTYGDMAKGLGISLASFSGKMKTGGFTFKEIKTIKRDILKTDLSLDVLFEEAE